MSSEIADLVENLSRRGFIGGAAGAIATSAALTVPLPLGEPSIEQMAKSLHYAVRQFMEERLPTHVQVCAGGRSLNLEMEDLLDSSVAEIEILLLPLFGGAT